MTALFLAVSARHAGAHRQKRATASPPISANAASPPCASRIGAASASACTARSGAGWPDGLLRRHGGAVLNVARGRAEARSVPSADGGNVL
jgi:hypothetical protein